ncbi:glycoside hydrolase family 16 protein [Herbaspirillum sp.]|uniref:glycoside hydrolase family 16 protein n=1 Tax=Herbaspirillum sp. TaxID=1890675 RepID=UPI001B138150|nr:glycoside hydrolase family 16 protein [Herbaspirillum sp.]MBO9535879.1 glycoside hydrolase family 16 protein [Herbaspirillum sp.]
MKPFTLFFRMHPAGTAFAACVALFEAAPGQAQQAISLPVPTQAAVPGCVPVSATGGATVSLRRTFFDDFAKLDLDSGRWTPHYDGGYDDANQRWLGYDWVVKRTAPAAHEQQIYVDQNYKGTAPIPLRLNPFRAGNGLTITADRVPAELANALPGFLFTSGLLTTRKSFLQLYGYFEMRGKVPEGKNLLPAFWMLPWDKSWPPELDIMEAPGHVPDKIVSTVHWKEPGGQLKASGCRTALAGFGNEFHTYGALWTPERIVYYIDRKPVAQISTPPGFDRPMYMIVNLAVGGSWVGMATPDAPMPVKFDVKHIAAYTMGDPAACTTAANGVMTCQGQ